MLSDYLRLIVDRVLGRGSQPSRTCTRQPSPPFPRRQSRLRVEELEQKEATAVWAPPQGSDLKWSTATNWDIQNVPDTPSEIAAFRATSNVACVQDISGLTVGGIEVGLGYTQEITLQGSTTVGTYVQLDGIVWNHSSLTITSGATLSDSGIGVAPNERGFIYINPGVTFVIESAGTGEVPNVVKFSGQYVENQGVINWKKGRIELGFASTIRTTGTSSRFENRTTDGEYLVSSSPGDHYFEIDYESTYTQFNNTPTQIHANFSLLGLLPKKWSRWYESL